MFESIRPHLVELRQRLFKSILAVFIGFVVAFTFHNAILSWITKPLNDALTEVGKIIESRNYQTWKVKEANATKSANSNLKRIKNSPELAFDLAMNAKSLEETLTEASKILNDKNATTVDKTLAKLLIASAKSAHTLSQTGMALSKALSKELNVSIGAEAERLREKSFDGMITTHQVGGAFFVALKVSFFAGLLLALPVVLWQIWQFVAPGLYENEKKMVLPFVIGGSVMFIIGVLFAYYIVTPFGFQFLITFGSFLYTPLINIEDYVGFFTKIMFGFGLAFELPVFAYFLGMLGLITDRTLIDFFKYAIVIIFVLAAILTPPDVLTQMLMALPLILLYGLSILIVRFVNPETKDDEEEDDDDLDKAFDEAENEFKKLEQ